MNHETSTEVASAGKTDTVQAVKYHPIRGATYGFVLGIGLALLLIAFSVITIQFTMPVIVIILVTALGGAWGRFGPLKERS